MKKLISLILTFLLLVTLIGCTKENEKKSENNSEQKTAVVKEYKIDQAYKANAEKQMGEAGEIEVLTTEDRAVKAEIAKYSDTKVDFRSKRVEKIGDITYDLTFSKMGSTTVDSVSTDITYVTDAGDEFCYDLATGRLIIVDLKSQQVRKASKKIDVTSAKAIADAYAAEVCEIDKYFLSEEEERENGYMFTYNKNVFGYATNDRVRVMVGFDGNITYTAIRVYPVNEDNFTVDKSWFELEIEKLKQKNENIIIEDAYISRDHFEDIVYFDVKYKILDNNGDVVTSGIEREKIPQS